MKIRINNQEVTVTSSPTVRELLQQAGTPCEGVAVAVNDSVVPRSRWDTARVGENDNVLIIKASRGG